MAYNKEYYQAHKEERKARRKALYQAHKEESKARNRAYYQAHKEEIKAYKKAWRESHKEESNEWCRNYQKEDVNSKGIRKNCIRNKSRSYLSKHGTKIDGYEIHHCCTYTEPYKFIYCSKEIHLKIHKYLRDNNIDADSNHFEQIKHLLDNTVVLYGVVKNETEQSESKD